jgi:hypothetical protein
MHDLTIVTIATNKYFDFLIANLDGLADARDGFGTTQVVIFTNRASDLPTMYRNLELKFVDLDDLGWPEITLLRYEILVKKADVFSGSRIMWIDADMLILRALDVSRLITDDSTVYMAKHPAFLGGAFPGKLTVKQLIGLFRMKVHKVIKGQRVLGTWEERGTSLAFVPKLARRNYVHGAVWMGPTVQVLQMCEVLAARTRSDLQNGIVALWHDESHLNWYLSNFPERCRLLPDHFSAWEDSLWYKQADSWVLSVDKSQW